nr:hypothetical protein [Burkholderia sp. WAC0059]
MVGTRTLAADHRPRRSKTWTSASFARFDVVESGSAWLSEREYGVNALGYIAQHLVVLLDPAQVLADRERRSSIPRPKRPWGMACVLAFRQVTRFERKCLTRSSRLLNFGTV